MSRLMLKSLAVLVIGFTTAAVGFAQRQPADESKSRASDGSAAPAAQRDNKKSQSAKATFEVYKDRSGDYRWRLRATNTQILAIAAQGYSDKRSCLNAIESVKRDVADAPVEEKEAAAQGKDDAAKAGSEASGAAKNNSK